MKKKKVKKELQIKIKKYLEYALEIETSIDSNEAYLNAYLNDSLKNELIHEIHGKTLFNSPLFSVFDLGLLARVAHIVEEIFYSPEDTIFLVNNKLSVVEKFRRMIIEILEFISSMAERSKSLTFILILY